jgi:peptidyl-prolyl cis-trans isomerase SurA
MSGMSSSVPRKGLPLGRVLAAALFAFVLAGAGAARAQVVVMVNGSPVTEIDIQQRTKLIQISTNKTPTRQQVIDELINDHLKIFIAKRYSLEISESEVNTAFGNMAQRSHVTPAQLEQSLAGRGLSLSTLKLRIRADLAWGQLVRGKFISSLQIGEADIRTAMQARGEEAKESVGYLYTVYPVVLVGPHATPPEAEARRREAEALRGRFQSCNEGLRMVRNMRDVVVREPILRNSADLSPQLREVLDKMEIGRLTAPENTSQGIQMFAVCDRKANKADSPAKRQIREEIYNKRFEAESKKFLDEIRRQAMIEYRQPH